MICNVRQTHEVPGVEPLPVVELAPALSNDVKEVAQIGETLGQLVDRFVTFFCFLRSFAFHTFHAFHAFPGNPRRVRLLRTLRKRLWGPRKQIVVEHATAIEPQDVAADTNIQKVHKRQTIYYSDNPKPPRRPPAAARTDRGFFDDVFEVKEFDPMVAHS